jgi:hypothetical protein
MTKRRLAKVKRNAHLHWPVGYGTNAAHYRGGEGYIVDLDGPFEDEWLEGQAFKLEPCEEGEPSEITNGRAVAMLREHAKSLKSAPLTPAEVLLRNEREARKPAAAPTAPPAPDPEPSPAEDGGEDQTAKTKRKSKRFKA